MNSRYVNETNGPCKVAGKLGIYGGIVDAKQRRHDDVLDCGEYVDDAPLSGTKTGRDNSMNQGADKGKKKNAEHGPLGSGLMRGLAIGQCCLHAAHDRIAGVSKLDGSHSFKIGNRVCNGWNLIDKVFGERKTRQRLETGNLAKGKELLGCRKDRSTE